MCQVKKLVGSKKYKEGKLKKTDGPKLNKSSCENLYCFIMWCKYEKIAIALIFMCITSTRTESLLYSYRRAETLMLGHA